MRACPPASAITQANGPNLAPMSAAHLRQPSSQASSNIRVLAISHFLHTPSGPLGTKAGNPRMSSINNGKHTRYLGINLIPKWEHCKPDLFLSWLCQPPGVLSTCCWKADRDVLLIESMWVWCWPSIVNHWILGNYDLALSHSRTVRRMYLI